MFFDKTNVWDMPHIVNLATETWVKISGCDPKKDRNCIYLTTFLCSWEMLYSSISHVYEHIPADIKHGLLENATFTVIN